MTTLDNDTYELILGSSFDRKSTDAPSYHSLRFNFKPASVDGNSQSKMVVAAGDHITMNMPHKDGRKETVFRGNKRSVNKECVLIVQPDTGQCTLERLSSTIGVKRTHEQLISMSSSSASSKTTAIPSTGLHHQHHSSQEERPLSCASNASSTGSGSKPRKPPAIKVKSAGTTAKKPPIDVGSKAPTKPAPQKALKPSPVKPAQDGSSSSDLDSSSSSGSGDDSGDENATPSSPITAPPCKQPVIAAPANKHSVAATNHSKKPAAHQMNVNTLLSNDLQLSESGSDSD